VKIADLLDKTGPMIGNVYQVYDGTYAMFQMGGGYWKRWNARFREPLIKQQNANGSWGETGGFVASGGSVVATAFNLFSLEVYYRYLPVNR
ncbi:MAG: hypothetical protein KAG97_09880, partial [Victivallales bacterium]|nr:hypothetical protein [Victivallales bacterium]